MIPTSWNSVSFVFFFFLRSILGFSISYPLSSYYAPATHALFSDIRLIGILNIKAELNLAKRRKKKEKKSELRSEGVCAYFRIRFWGWGSNMTNKASLSQYFHFFRFLLFIDIYNINIKYLFAFLAILFTAGCIIGCIIFLNQNYLICTRQACTRLSRDPLF